MRSTTAALATIASLLATTGTAVARPASDPAGSVRSNEPVAAAPAAPAVPSQDDTDAIVYVLLGVGGSAALAGAAYGGVIAMRRHERPTSA